MSCDLHKGLIKMHTTFLLSPFTHDWIYQAAYPSIFAREPIQIHPKDHSCRFVYVKCSYLQLKWHGILSRRDASLDIPTSRWNCTWTQLVQDDQDHFVDSKDWRWRADGRHPSCLWTNKWSIKREHFFSKRLSIRKRKNKEKRRRTYKNLYNVTMHRPSESTLAISFESRYFEDSVDVGRGTSDRGSISSIPPSEEHL